MLNSLIWLIAGENHHHENLSTAAEIAAIVSDNQSEISIHCQAVRLALHRGNSKFFTHIDTDNSLYLSLHYVLLFLYEDSDWHWELQLQSESDNSGCQCQWKWISLWAYHCFWLFKCQAEFSSLLWAAWLFQQYLIDVWTTINQEKLNWLRTHQAEIQFNLYNSLADALIAENSAEQSLDFCFVLSSSYVDDHHYMHQLFQNLMTIFQFYDYFTLFIIMTSFKMLKRSSECDSKKIK